MKKTCWVKKASTAVLLSTALLFSAPSGFAAANSPSEAVVVSEAYELLGKPYQYNGNTPDGFDSAGYVSYVLEQMGVNVNDTISALQRAGSSVSVNELRPGDVLIFQSTSRYVGIYVGNDTFLYASRSKGKVIEQRLSLVKKSLQDARRVLRTSHITHSPQGPVGSDNSANTGNSGNSVNETKAVELGKQIIAYGEKFLGVPYKFGAEYETSRRFDCSSFTQYVYKQFGIKLPREARPQSQVGVKVAREDLRPGDLVFFSTGRTMKYPADSVKRIGHVGIYAGNDRVLHTYGEGGVRYSRMDRGWWDDHYVTAVRVIK